MHLPVYTEATLYPVLLHATLMLRFVILVLRDRAVRWTSARGLQNLIEVLRRLSAEESVPNGNYGPSSFDHGEHRDGENGEESPKKRDDDPSSEEGLREVIFGAVHRERPDDE